jgi:hypothetical protein
MRKNLYTLVVMIVLHSSVIFADSFPIKIVENDEGFWVIEDQQKIFFYQRTPKSFNGKYLRSHYIHPLFGLDGEMLTEDFPEDHLHHRGVFWAWHQIKISDYKVGDSWSLEDFFWDINSVNIIDKDKVSTTVKIDVNWKSPNWRGDGTIPKPFLEETTILRIFKTANKCRMIDFKIELLAIEEELYIGGSEDEKGYGGFSLRIKTPKDLIFLSKTGEVTPKILQITGGPWLDFFGSFHKNKKSGVALLCHPLNSNYPPPWILRKERSMQNVVYPGRKSVHISNKEKTILRYRLLIHKNQLSIEQLNSFQREYSTVSW